MVKNNRHLACCKVCRPDFRPCSNTASNDDFLDAFADDTTIRTLAKTKFDMKSNLVAIFERVILRLMRIIWPRMLVSHIFLFFSEIGIAFPQLTNFQVPSPESRVVQFLHILLDEKLSFRNHIAMTSVKVSWSLGIIRKFHFFKISLFRLSSIDFFFR